jgi:pyruvate/2-oxoglutarate dehydrogenase complex dihydrolipoamide dehydrogenase (E3) component
MRTIPELIPRDAYNAELLANVHPESYTNPTPKGRYNLVVIGAGSAGLITAAVAAGLGARVALIERHLMGGDCLNVGCIPSKSIIRSARVVGDIRAGERLGVRLAGSIEVDFGAVMERMRRVRSGISKVDSVARYAGELGVDVYLGEAQFAGSDTVRVDETALRFARAVIATGARPAAPPIPGLSDAGFLTNETVFSLTERPERLAVIGGGPIGCELAQAFQRLGCQVTLFEAGAQIMSREDPDAAEIVQQALVRDGVDLVLEAKIERVESTTDEILVGAGRIPNVENLGLEAVGVEFDTRSGVQVDDQLRTTHPHIYAAGDVCLAAKFTHMADATAKIVVQNALFFGRKKLSDLVVPWCTFTDPEVAHVGLSEREATAGGIPIDTYKIDLAENDRARAEGAEEGFAVVHTKRGGDRILGATLVAPHAGEMISEISVAIAGGLGLAALTNVIHPYPTESEVWKALGGQYTRTRLTPFVARLFRGLLALRR